MLTIINVHNQSVSVNVCQPESVSEISGSFTNSTSTDGMIIFNIKPEICLNPMYFHFFQHVLSDIIFIDWHGNIKSIQKNTYPDENIQWNPFAVCVLGLKSGLCDKYNIEIGDTVVHKKLRFLPNNKITLFDNLFEKATPEKISCIKSDDIMFVFYVRVGCGDNLLNTVLIITKDCKYYIDISSEKYKSLIMQIFPLIMNLQSNANFYALNTESENVLFIHKDIYKKFIKSTDNNVLTDDCIKKACIIK